MVLIFPVGPIIGLLLYLIVRSLARRKAQTGTAQTQPGVPAPRATQIRISIGHLFLFGIFYLPLALIPATVVGEQTESAWPGLLTFAAAIFAICLGPRWLAWRVLGPWGLPAVGRAVLWLAPSFTLSTFRGNLELFSAAFGGPPKPQRWTADPWFLFTRALRSDREGDPGRVEVLLELLRDLASWRLPWRLRGQGFELLAWPAIQAGDWDEALRRLAQGRGRGVRLLRRVASAHIAGVASPFLLWLAWLLAPERRRTRPLVLAVMDPERTAAIIPPPLAHAPQEEDAATDGVWLRHLKLLADAAEGRPVRPSDIEAVAEDWEDTFRKAGRMRLLSRGAELEVPDVQAVVADLRPALQAELEAVAESVDGPWPEPQRRDSLAAEVCRRRRDRLFAAVQVEVDPFLGQNGFQRKLEDPLAELERWLQLRRALRRLLEASGENALPTTWYNGLRIAACNWPVFLLEAYGLDAHWACRQMFRWSEAQARRMGDQEIAKLSHGNLRQVRSFLT
jgi:hypothetical protein